MSGVNIKLYGEDAFYNKRDYIETTTEELTKENVLENVHFSFRNESKAWFVAKVIIAVIIPIIGIGWGIHALIGNQLFQNANAANKSDALNLRKRLAVQLKSDLRGEHNSNSWAVKRITVEVNGSKVDAYIVGKPKNLRDSHKWVLKSVGKDQIAEKAFDPGKDENGKDKNIEKESELGKMLESLGDANALIFNYTGKASSEGNREKNTIVNSYKAMLALLEKEQGEGGLGAKQIIMYGHSTGAVVQAEALDGHKLKKGIQYVAVKSHAPADLPTNKVQQFFNWNMSTVRSSLKLNCPEIILQTVDPKEEELKAIKERSRRDLESITDEQQIEHVLDTGTLITEKPEHYLKYLRGLQTNYREIQSADEIRDDGIISKSSTLAKVLLDANKREIYAKKKFIGVYERHTEGVFDWKPIAAHINGSLVQAA